MNDNDDDDDHDDVQVGGGGRRLCLCVLFGRESGTRNVWNVRGIGLDV